MFQWQIVSKIKEIQGSGTLLHNCINPCLQLRHPEEGLCGRAQGHPGQRQERVQQGGRGGDPQGHRQKLITPQEIIRAPSSYYRIIFYNLNPQNEFVAKMMSSICCRGEDTKGMSVRSGSCQLQALPYIRDITKHPLPLPSLNMRKASNE